MDQTEHLHYYLSTCLSLLLMFYRTITLCFALALSVYMFGLAMQYEGLCVKDPGSRDCNSPLDYQFEQIWNNAQDATNFHKMIDLHKKEVKMNL